MPRKPTQAPDPKPAGDGVAIASNNVDGRRFRAVADYTNDWESWHAPDGRLIWVNPSVQRITGYSVDECLAMEDYPLPTIAQEDRERIAKLLVSARNRTSGQNAEFRSLHRNGETRWMSLAWQPMYGECAEYLGIRTSIRDVTELRRLREQLRLHAEHLEQLVQERTSRLRQLEQRQRQMEKLAALGQLAAGVAHEINNPLAGLRNAFELIKSSLSPEHEHFELLDLIDREIERISGITHQMYQLYRRNPQRPSEFAMNQIVAEVVYLLESVARGRQVVIESVVPEAPLQVLLPEGEVKQVLYNVLRNAIQASPPGESVSVRLKGAPHEVVVEVSDRGPGIPGDVLPRIFDPFFSTKHGERESGMGLGLSVSRSLVEALGGRIDVDSEAGRGTTFSVVLPQRAENSPEGSDA